MIKVFKWWWAWGYEEIEDWLERMEAGGLRLVETRFSGVYFHFEKCIPTKARYCTDYQTKLTPEYMTLISDDCWKLYQIGAGWYILRKEYQDERPNLYNNFEGLISRNKTLLTWMIALLFIELLIISTMIWDTYKFPNNSKLAVTGIVSSLILALFAFCITNLAMQISKFSKKE
ncbi:MAG TPA: DUF2812 domain-containing protein [Ruminiclostridium sp.]